MRRLRASPEPLSRRNRFGLVSFHDADHGDGRGECLAWHFPIAPFGAARGGQRFRFQRGELGSAIPARAAPAAQTRLIARVDQHDEDGAPLETTVSGTLAPLDGRRLLRAVAALPLRSCILGARIRWQAQRLWRKSIAWVSRAPPPSPTASA